MIDSEVETIKHLDFDFQDGCEFENCSSGADGLASYTQKCGCSEDALLCTKHWTRFLDSLDSTTYSGIMFCPHKGHPMTGKTFRDTFARISWTPL
jgi:hypothetical protein